MKPPTSRSVLAATLTAPVPEMVCIVATRPSRRAALPAPKTSSAESLRNVASPSIGRYSLKVRPLCSSLATRPSASLMDEST